MRRDLERRLRAIEKAIEPVRERERDRQDKLAIEKELEAYAANWKPLSRSRPEDFDQEEKARACALRRKRLEEEYRKRRTETPEQTKRRHQREQDAHERLAAVFSEYRSKGERKRDAS